MARAKQPTPEEVKAIVDGLLRDNATAVQPAARPTARTRTDGFDPTAAPPIPGLSKR